VLSFIFFTMSSLSRRIIWHQKRRVVLNFFNGSSHMITFISHFVLINWFVCPKYSHIC